MKSGFRQHVEGEFEVIVKGQNHCGIDDEPRKAFRYEVDIFYPPDALDERGFLLDNLTFRSYFSSIGETDMSCERLAQSAHAYFCGLLQGRGLHCRVAIWGIAGYARIEFETDLN